jgi:hypothetical protein
MATLTLGTGGHLGRVGQDTGPTFSEGAIDRLADQSASPPVGSISFVVVTENAVRHVGAVVEVIEGALRDGDEAILLTRSDRVAELPGPSRPWLRVVGLPDASVFALRGHIPAAARRDWVVLLEEHTLITRATLALVRDMIRDRPAIDLIVILGRNLTSVTPWGWANFLHTFALAWAPVDRPPPFSPVTSVAVRRAALEAEAPLQEGEWELRAIPRVFGRGRVGYANEIHIDHVRPLSFASCFALNFHNARAGASQQRRFGVPARAVIVEGWYNLARRPRELASALDRRRHELPAGTSWRLRVVGLAFCLGATIGALLGAGRSAHKLD